MSLRPSFGIARARTYVAPEIVILLDYLASKQANEISNCPSNAASRFCDALKKIEDGITTAEASYPVLRVFASWPANAKIERTQDLKKSKKGKATKSRAKVDKDSVDVFDTDPHPLAMLRLDNFAEISNLLAMSWFRGDMERYLWTL